MLKMNKKGEFYFTAGFVTRIIAALIVGVSLPFLVINPSNPIAQAIFAFGNFLMVMGANVK